MRGMHFYGASAMFFMVGAHMIRTFLFGSYKFPREMSWLTGLVLLALLIGMGFSGQLLRWDQNAVWSVILAAETAGRVPIIGDYIAEFILGGQTVGALTLSRFFAIHVFLVPGLMIAFLGIHLWLVIRNGISEAPIAGKPVNIKTYRDEYHKELEKDGVPFFPDAAIRDVLFSLGLVIVICVASVIWGAPQVEAPPDPAIIKAQPRPDWYFLWMFAIMALLPAQLEQWFIVVVPLIVAVILVGIPICFPAGERHWSKRPWAVGLTSFVVLGIGALWYAGINADWSPDFDAPYLPESIVGTATGPVAEGAVLFHDKGCIRCHRIADIGGRRGPDLSTIGDVLTHDDFVIRIANGGLNMPAFAAMLKEKELNLIVKFLESRKRPKSIAIGSR